MRVLLRLFGKNWQEKNRFRANPDVGLFAGQAVSRLAHHLARQAGVLPDGTAEFWRRTIVKYMAMTINSSIPADQDGRLASATRLVRSVEEYLQATGDGRLIGLSRRTLHRAFHEVFGIGPLTLLRHKRLCAVRSILRQSSPETTTNETLVQAERLPPRRCESGGIALSRSF